MPDIRVKSRRSTSISAAVMVRTSPRRIWPFKMSSPGSRPNISPQHVGGEPPQALDLGDRREVRQQVMEELEIVVVETTRRPRGPGERIRRPVRIEERRDRIIRIARRAELIEKREGQSRRGVEAPSTRLPALHGKSHRTRQIGARLLKAMVEIALLDASLPRPQPRHPRILRMQSANMQP